MSVQKKKYLPLRLKKYQNNGINADVTNRVIDVKGCFFMFFISFVTF